MSAFFTGWCLCGVLWCIDTDDRGIHLWMFLLGAVLNGILWYGESRK